MDISIPLLHTRLKQSDETGGDKQETIVERIVPQGDLDDDTTVV
jgi:hypothetical protein